MKTVVYGATRNLYRNLLPCINSVLRNGNVDEIVLMIEDDIFPYRLPKRVRTINVSGQKWFKPTSPNYESRWTYMVLMKLAVTKVFPDYDKVLVLDCDTIVEGDLSPLWGLDMTNYWYAAVPQTRETYPEPYNKEGEDFVYINAGSLFCNLEKLRKDGKDDELIEAINTRPFTWIEQDCISELCQGGIKVLPGRYNRSDYTLYDQVYTVRHFAADKQWRHKAIVQLYDAEEILYD